MAGEPAVAAAWLSVPAKVDYGAVFQALGFPLSLLMVRDGEARFVAVNETFSRMTRLTQAMVEDRPLADVLSAEAALALTSGAARAAESLEPVRIETLLAASGGDPHGVLLTPLERLDGGRLVLVDAERRRSSRLPGERGHSLAFDRLARVNEGLIYIYDVPKGRSLYVARHLAEMLGGSRTDGFVISDVRALVHPEDRPVVEGHLAALKAMDDWVVETVAFRLPHAEGGWRWLEVRARVLARDRRGQVRRVLGVATDITERRSMAEALDAAAKALLDAAESERRRVGRELHDSTAQHLVAIDLGLGALQRRLEANNEVEARIFRDLRTSLATAQREIRAFSYLLHPPLLKRRGLIDTTRRFVEGFSRRANLELDLRLPTRLRALPDDAEVVLFRVTQEALMNVYRHAGARRVRVELILRKNAAIVEVEDDGVGMSDAAPGVGITGMRARLAQLGGRLTITPLLVGTKVRAFIPLGLDSP